MTTYRAPGTVTAVAIGPRVSTPSGYEPDATVPGDGPSFLVTILLDRQWGGHEVVFPWGLIEPKLGARVRLICEVIE